MVVNSLELGSRSVEDLAELRLIWPEETRNKKLGEASSISMLKYHNTKSCPTVFWRRRGCCPEHKTIIKADGEKRAGR